MPTDEQWLLALASKYCDKGILIDTNVLLLYLFGKFQPGLVGKDRLAIYQREDAELIVQFLARFKHIQTTQHVLAETSNLMRQMVRGEMRRRLSMQFHPLFCLDKPESFQARQIDGTKIDLDVFARLGLTDAGLTSLVRADALLLTDDLDLYVAAVTTGGDAINFTHMREAAGTL
jgi:hypothetical protein